MMTYTILSPQLLATALPDTTYSKDKLKYVDKPMTHLCKHIMSKFLITF